MQTLVSCLCATSCSTPEANIQVAFVEHLDLTVVLHRYYILAGWRSDSLDTHSFFTVKSSPSAFRIDLSLINSGGKGRTTFWRLKNKTFKTLAFHLSTFKVRLGARAFPNFPLLSPSFCCLFFFFFLPGLFSSKHAVDLCFYLLFFSLSAWLPALVSVSFQSAPLLLKGHPYGFKTVTESAGGIEVLH